MDNSESSRRHDEELEFNLREWHLKARVSSRRENTTNSRRYSASYVGNATIREEDNINSRSFRSNFTISSTASSPGYNHLRDNEIDPSTYSFTTALKALQGRSAGHVRQCLSPEGFALNSKWDEADRYICNPLSGQVPMECLSAKTLSGRSFHSLVANRFTMSAPVVYSAKPRPRSSKPPAPMILPNDKINNKMNEKQKDKRHVPTTLTTQAIEVQRKAMILSKTREVGTQISPPDHQSSSSSTSPFSTPSFKERPSLQRPVRHEEENEHGLVPSSRTNINSFSEKLQAKLKEKDETRKEDEVVKGEDQATRIKMQVQKVKTEKHCRSKQYAACLLSFKNLWMRKRKTEKHKSKGTTAIFSHNCLNITEY